MRETGGDRALLVAAAATLASRGVGIAVSLATSVVVARAWGVDGKGLVSLLAAATTLAVRIGVIGFDAAIAQFLLVRRADVATSLGTVLSLAACAGVGASLLAHAGLILFGAGLGEVPLAAARLQATVLPAAFVLFVATYVFFALGRARAFAVFDVVYRLGTLAAVAAAAALGAGVLAAVSLQATSTALAGAAGLALIWRWSGRGWRWSTSAARAMTGYGARTYVYALGRYVLAYGSLLVSGAALGASDAGVFSVALLLGEPIALSAGSVNLAFGRTVAISAMPWDHARRVALRVLLLMAVLATGVGVSAPAVVPVVFGEDFAPSALLFLWLAPGVVALGLEQIIGSYFGRMGMSWRIAGLMAGGAALSAAAWAATASSGLAALALMTSISQVAVTVGLFAAFKRATLEARAGASPAAVPGVTGE